ncbi:MAG: hypothetical protein R3B60_01335 [Candidatus Paceibacterota bacterium]
MNDRISNIGKRVVLIFDEGIITKWISNNDIYHVKKDNGEIVAWPANYIAASDSNSLPRFKN